MAIDPSGRGQDELAYSIGGVVNSYISLLKQGGKQGGYSEENLYELAKLAKEYKVNRIKIESNFGDGMFTALFLPILKKVGYQCEVTEVRHNTQKERRIIDTLEPVMNQHRLIVDKKVIEDDANSIKIYPLEKQQQYSLFYQMTRITKDRGCLAHDDKLDCLSISGIILLLIEPLNVFNYSFIMSFVLTFAIIVSSKILKRYNKIIQTILLSFRIINNKAPIL